MRRRKNELLAEQSLVLRSFKCLYHSIVNKRSKKEGIPNVGYSENLTSTSVDRLSRQSEHVGSFPIVTWTLCAFLVVFSIMPLLAKTYYVSTAGSDTAAGTIDQPFLTVQKAYSLMLGGDTIVVRGGTFNLAATISLSSRTGADSTHRCYLLAYPGERPVFDFTAQTSSDGIKVNGNYWYLKGLESRYAAHNGIAINGKYNVIENCSVHDNRNTGMQLGNGASYNRIINCDSYYNYDPPLGGNADGFSPKLDVGTGNYFYGCRSWQNSDDGWDGYLHPSDSVITLLENCWSFMNGYLKDGSVISTGNGNGFKMVGGTIPMETVCDIT